jgi:hypothetical protein
MLFITFNAQSSLRVQCKHKIQLLLCRIPNFFSRVVFHLSLESHTGALGETTNPTGVGVTRAADDILSRNTKLKINSGLIEVYVQDGAKTLKASESEPLIDDENNPAGDETVSFIDQQLVDVEAALTNEVIRSVHS